MKEFPGSDQTSDDTSARKSTFVISIQVSEFSSDMIQATIENSALATKIFIFPPLFFFFQFFKTLERTLSSSVDSHDSFKRNKVSNRKRKTFSSCIWHPRKDCHTNFKQKKNSAAQARHQATRTEAEQPQRWEEVTWCVLTKPSCQPHV